MVGIADINSSCNGRQVVTNGRQVATRELAFSLSLVIRLNNNAEYIAAAPPAMSLALEQQTSRGPTK